MHQKCEIEMNKDIKDYLLHGEWKEENRTKMKNWSIQQRVCIYIVKNNRHFHFKFQKKAPCLQMSKGDFRQKCFPIQQLCSCRNGEKEYREKWEKGGKDWDVIRVWEKKGWERKRVLKKEDWESKMRENGEIKRDERKKKWVWKCVTWHGLAQMCCVDWWKFFYFWY